MKIKILFDKSVYAITILCIALAFIPAVFLFVHFHTIALLMIIIFGILPLFIAALFAPRYYLLEKDKMIIKKVMGEIIINKNDIESITTINPDMLKGSIRKCASGGFFGYWGLFYSKALKDFNMYAGSYSKNLVLIKRKTKKPYVITPKEIENFMNAVSIYFENIKQ